MNCKFLALQSTMRKPTAQTPRNIQKQGDVGLFHQHLTFPQADDTYVKEAQGKRRASFRKGRLRLLGQSQERVGGADGTRIDLHRQYNLFLSVTILGFCLCSEPGSPVAQAGIAKDDLELSILPFPLPKASTADMHI